MHFIIRPSRILAVIVVLLLSTMSMKAQSVITGTVSDSEGPLIGATVKIKGKKEASITDYDGNFSVKAENGDVLVITFVGFKDKEVKVGKKAQINIVMESDDSMLNDVVVIGYGQMKRSDVTGSVVSVDEKAIAKAVPTSIDQVLQGRAAGVQIQANSGTPGGSSSIKIRGTNSINLSSQPIFVIDGVVIDSASNDDTSNPLSGINPSDIISLDVLKDASATAIYGSRASNGVIMVTTKRGKSGEATITYDGNIGIQNIPKHIDVLNLQEYAQHSNDIAAANIKTAQATFVRPDLLSKGTDWQRELFNNAQMTSHSLSITGGSDKVTYAFSGGYLNQEGIALGSGFERITLRSNIDAQLKQWLRGGISFSFGQSKQKVGTDNGIIMNALTSQPSVAVYNTDGTFDGPDDSWMPENPVALALIRDNYNRKMNNRFNTYLEATIIKGLTFKTETSADFNNNRSYYYEPDYKFGIKTNDIRTSKWTKVNTNYWVWKNILTYNNTFADKHNINVMLGHEMNESHWEQQASTATGFISNSATDPNAGDITESTGTGQQVNNSILSYFGRAFYSFDDRYLLTFTMRRDGSSKFASENRWGWFPSAAFAWKISNEKFMKGTANVVENLKLRLGWGATGNQNVENWAYMALLATKPTPWGTGVLNGNTANPDLRWETTYSTNVGIDVNLFHNRIEFIADWYYKNTTDLLLQPSLPAFLGSSGQGAASNPWGNIGSIRNTGIELTLNTVNISKKDFTWRSNMVLSLNRNKVTALDTDGGYLYQSLQIGSDTQNVTKTVVGQPIGQFWGYKVIGMFNEPGDFYYKDANGNTHNVALPEGESIGENEAWLGDYIFADINGDGVINNEDQTFIGNPEPKFTWGFGNTFTWKGFDLTIQFSGSYGNDVLNYNRRWTEVTASSTNLSKCVLNYARVEKIDPNGADDFRNFHVVNAGTTIPRLYTESFKNTNNRVSDAYIEDGSYIRLQNITLSYTLPKSIVRAIKLENLKVYCNIQNLYTWTKYSGYDPEVGSLYGSTLLNGIDYGRYPSSRTFTFGMNVSF